MALGKDEYGCNESADLELQYVMPAGFPWHAPFDTLIRAPQMAQNGVSWKHYNLV